MRASLFLLTGAFLCKAWERAFFYFFCEYLFFLSSVKWLILYYSLDGWILTLSNSAEKGAILFFEEGAAPFFLTVARRRLSLWMGLFFGPFFFCRMLLNKAEKGVNIFFVIEYLVRWYSRNLRPSYPLVFIFFFVYFPFFPPFFFGSTFSSLCEAMRAWWTKATHVIRLPKPLLNTYGYLNLYWTRFLCQSCSLRPLFSSCFFLCLHRSQLWFWTCYHLCHLCSKVCAFLFFGTTAHLN